MELFYALILGVVEGITEFLPISSTGHMILVVKLLNIPQTEFLKSFEIIIQLGAIGAIILLYGSTIWKHRSLWPIILTAFIPTAAIGFLVYPLVKSVLLGNLIITLASLFTGGVIFLFLEKILAKKNITARTVNEITMRQSVVIGFVQALSIIPGVSRSAASIFGGMGVGLNRTSAVEFSFFLAIPTMVAATSLDLFKNGSTFTPDQWVLLAIGFLTAFATALIAVQTFVQYIQKHSFVAFGIYRIILSVAFYFFVLK